MTGKGAALHPLERERQRLSFSRYGTEAGTLRARAGAPLHLKTLPTTEYTSHCFIAAANYANSVYSTEYGRVRREAASPRVDYKHLSSRTTPVRSPDTICFKYIVGRHSVMK